MVRAAVDADIMRLGHSDGHATARYDAWVNIPDGRMRIRAFLHDMPEPPQRA